MFNVYDPSPRPAPTTVPPLSLHRLNGLTHCWLHHSVVTGDDYLGPPDGRTSLGHVECKYRHRIHGPDPPPRCPTCPSIPVLNVPTQMGARRGVVELIWRGTVLSLKI